MKLSEYSLSVLKNFATINSSIILLSGKVQKTMSNEQSILAEAELEDDFPSEFGIFDLNQFLGNVSTLGGEIEFTDKFATLTDGTMALKYYGCPTELIKSPPKDKELTIKNPDVTFELSNAALAKLLKLATMNVLPHLSIVGRDGKLTVKTHDKSNDTSNSVGYELSDYTGDDFVASFKTENLKVLPDDYDVEVKFGAFAKFTSKTRKLKYFIALETK